jgi:UDP-glucose 4-epimerase
MCRDVPHVIAARRAGDPSRLVASNAKARGSLGWTPRYSTLDTIVSTAWAWHKKHPKGYGDTE